MALRKEEAQFELTFITDESRNFAKTILATKEFNKQIEDSRRNIEKLEKELKKVEKDETKRAEILKKIAAEEQNVATNMKKIGDEAKKVEKIDLSKLTPAQLVERAKQLEQSMRHMSQTHPEFKLLQAELQRTNVQIKDLKDNSRALAAATSLWQQAFTVAVGVLGGLSLENILQSLAAYAEKLFGLGISAESMVSKTQTVFGQAEGIVRDFAASTAQSVGLSQREFVRLATDIGDLLVPMGFTQERAAQLSAELVKQGGVLAEWSNGKFTGAEATEILQKALLGERDALNSLGIDIKQELVDAELRRLGQDKLTGSAMRQAEAMVTLRLITEQSAAANQRFEKNSDSLVRKKAELRAKIAEITDGLSAGLIPAFKSLLSMGLGLLNFLITLGGVLIGVTKFVYDNRIAFGALLIGIAFLNKELILTNARLLWLNATTAVTAARTALMTAAQWALNAAMTANPIGVIITALSVVAIGLTEAYKRSENFRAGIAGLGSVLRELWQIVKETFGSLVQGFKSLSEGNLVNAGKSFLNFMVKTNPVGLAYTEGARLGKAFRQGYDDSKVTAAELAQDAARAAYENEADDRQVATSAQGKGGKKTKEEIEAAIKEALDAGQKVIDQHNAQRQLELEKRRQAENLSEQQFQVAQLEIQRQGLEEQLQLLRRYKGARATETLEAELKLLENERALQKARYDAAFAPKQEKAQSEMTPDELAADAERKLGVKREAGEAERTIRLDQLRTEEHDMSESARRKYEIEEEAAKAAMKLAEDERKFKEEQIKAELEARQRNTEAGLAATGQLFGGIADLLGQNEASRKKHAQKIKALQKAEVVTAGIAEVQKIWKNSADFGIFGTVLAVVQTAAAVARTAAAVQRIESTKFARGGFTGGGFGAADSTGFRQAGIVHEGEYVVPKWQVEDHRFAPALAVLEGHRLRGYASGGFVGGSTSPQFAAAAAPNSTVLDLSELTAVVARFEGAVAQMPRRVRADVIYTDIEDTGATLNSIRADAAI